MRQWGGGNLFVFVAGCGLSLVGAAPLFKAHEKKIHYAGATGAIAAGMSFALLSQVWYLPVCLLVSAVFVPQALRVSLIYYIEIITLGTICATLYSIMP
jgi:hypothetical protein